MRVVVLGAGFGGLELADRLSSELGDEADVVLIDRADGFIFGFAKLDVMFGHKSESEVRYAYRDVVKPGVRFVQADVTAIDAERKQVTTSAGTYDADILVIALGCDVDPSATPGLVESGQEFYSVPGAIATAAALDAFTGGHVVIGVIGTPFKCPPAPSETALLLHDFLTERHLREVSEISLVMPMGSPVPPSPEASQALLSAFAERGIHFHGDRQVQRLDPARRVVVFADGDELAFDLFLGVPVHRVPQVVAESGLCVDGWIPVDPHTLQTHHPDVYALGDVTSVGTPKAGAFSERQADIVADHLIARHRGEGSESRYDGVGVCYVEFGHEQVGRIEVAFPAGRPPSGQFDSPSEQLLAEKAAFGADRAGRWFGRS